MGDLMHALPALTDAGKALPGIRFDWVVDEAFAEVPSWHPAVGTIYKSAHRRWRKNLWKCLARGELGAFRRALNEHDYDAVIDAQNNVKSASISLLRRGRIHGMDADSVAEKPAHLAYAVRHHVDKNRHAIERQRLLFASALGYEVPDTPPDFGLKADAFRMPAIGLPAPYLVLVHNASWTTKLWPPHHWHELISLAGRAGYHVVLPGGSREELQRAAGLADSHANATALPRLSLSELGGVIERSDGAVCCDTGLAHLVAMVGRPAVTLYGPTSESLIGTRGNNQRHLVAASPPFTCAPCHKRYCHFNGHREEQAACMQAFSAESVWRALEQAMRPAGDE